MDRLFFPFRYEGLTFVPLARIGLKTRDGKVDYDFLVDTGADFTTLPKYMAVRLDLNLNSLKQSWATGLGGYTVRTWLTKLDLILSGGVVVNVNVSITNENSTPFLLGRADLLDVLYNWNFNATRKQIEFTKI